MVSRDMLSVRSGPASTWQWRQVWLQTFPTLIWRISSRERLSGHWSAPASASGNSRSIGTAPSLASCVAGDDSGDSRAARLGSVPRPITSPVSPRGSASGPHGPARSHRGSPRPRAPPRSSGRDRRPCWSASLLYASMQYGHCTACATARAMSDFSRTLRAPSAKTAPYQSKNFFARSLRFSPISGNRRRSSQWK